MPYLCERHFSTLMISFAPLAAMSLLEIDKIHKRRIKKKQVNRMISFFIVFSIAGIAVFGFNSDLKYRVKKGNPLKLREIMRQHFENNMQDAIIIYNDWNIDFQYFWRFKNRYVDSYWDNGILEEIKTTDKPVFFVLYPWSTVFDGVEKKELYKVFSLGEEEYKVYKYVP